MRRSGEANGTPGTTTSLAEAVARIEGGGDPDQVVEALGTSCDGRGSVVPEAYLEPLPQAAHLDRAPAGLLLDLCARACADARAIGERVAVFAAHRIKESRAYRRLGYRTVADYAREELRMTAREFRDLARLGRRLERLPRTREAFLDRELTRTQADVIAGIASEDDEERWLELARGGTVRRLKRAAREARRARQTAAAGSESGAEGGTTEPGPGATEPGPGTTEPGPGTVEPGPGTSVGADLPSRETRRRVAFEVPRATLGKIDAVLELASRVAGARLPAGTLWEFIGAEYLSGVQHECDTERAGEPRRAGELLLRQGRGDGAGTGPEPREGSNTEGTPAGRQRSYAPEDPTGRQRYLEEATRDWKFLPHTSMRVEPVGGWKRLAATAAELAGLVDFADSATAVDPTGPVDPFAPVDPIAPVDPAVPVDQTASVGPTAPIDPTGSGDPSDPTDPADRVECDVGARPLRATDVTNGLSPWELHRRMTAALEQAWTVDWQLGRLLAVIRNRRLWRDMWFSSFGHYVRERLGISIRHAQRLVRADRLALESPVFARAWKAGELSALQAEVLTRVLTFIGREESERAWIEAARRSTFDRFVKLVRCAEQLIAEIDPEWRRSRGHPAAAEARLREAERNAARLRRGESLDEGVDVEAAGGGGGFGGRGSDGGGPDGGGSDGGATVFVTSYAVWMTHGERETLERALRAARAQLLGGRSPPKRREPVSKTPPGSPESVSKTSTAGGEWDGAPPIWASLDVLLDAFVAEYGGERAEALAEKYPVFERDGWQCQVPGCRAVSALHAHHIVFRARGGGDEPANLVVTCDWHHKVLHEGWIRCVGKAPDRLYWELGVGDREVGPSEAVGVASPPASGCVCGDVPVARYFGDRRLGDDEYWDGHVVRKIPVAHAVT